MKMMGNQRTNVSLLCGQIRKEYQTLGGFDEDIFIFHNLLNVVLNIHPYKCLAMCVTWEFIIINVIFIIDAVIIVVIIVIAIIIVIL